MISREIEFRAPTTVGEALDALAELDGLGLDGEVALLAGGMSLLPLMNLGVRRPAGLVSLNHVDGLAAIDRTQRGWRIGAAVRHRDIAARTDLGPACGALATAARAIGDPQVRNRGTIGGSVAQAESFADYLPVLYALDARVEITGRDGARTIAATEFVRGPQDTALGRGELVTAIEIDAADGVAAYRRLARTEGSAPLVTAAAFAGPSETVVAVGGATRAPVRVRLAAADAADAAEAIAEAVGAAEPDARLAEVDRDYRGAMASVLGRRAVVAASDARVQTA
jgi:carbon-monoxide dehydrogenase medium subunit